MKKITIICLTALMALCSLTACGNSNQPANAADSQVSTASDDLESQASEAGAETPNESEAPETSEMTEAEQERVLPEPVYGNTRIRLSWAEDREIIVRLIDNDATADLVSQLPVSLPFEDYRGFQRDAILDLELGDAPSECDIFAGDFAYYAPWSHLTFFCEDFRYNNDLTPLGTIESGFEYLEEIDDGGEVLIEVVDQE